MFAVNGDVKLAYDDLGPATGRPLLMLMGMSASRFWWPPGLLAALQADGLRPIVMDLRDTGESTRMSAPYRAEDLTDDAVAVLDALRLPAAHLFGLSFGGVMGQRIALRHPDRVRSLTTFATGPSDAGMSTVALRYLHWGTQLKLLRLTRRAGRDDDIGAAVLRAAGYPDGDAIARAAAARDREHGIRSFRDPAAQSRQLRARWTGPPLAELHCPALVICGDADPVMRARASPDTAAAIRGARLVVLPGVGHVPPPAAWDRIAHEIRTLADG